MVYVLDLYPLIVCYACEFLYRSKFLVDLLVGYSIGTL